ncbi:protein STPG3 [Hippopotamus amphibius kiboko]|uniref:protein STPG3 n=1 Tax=Hippopotamus amphibius kiboko TaxID=575201 RepID=UPI0025927098|nr:protein STPG3 [Hippopotamus amphibius kiboko]
MNSDQKAVKFLADFHINGGRAPVHSPLTRRPPVSSQELPRVGGELGCRRHGVGGGVGVGRVDGGVHVSRRPSAAVLSSGLQPELGATWDEVWLQAGLRMPTGPLREPPPTCSRTLRALWLERRPPVVTDLDVPGPTKHQVPEASVRESSPHPRFTIGRRHPTREGGGRRAWHTMWFQSESPFAQKADFNRAQKWPSPAHYQPPSLPSCPAFSFRGRPASRAPEAQARLGRLQAWGAWPRAQPLLQTPPPVGHKTGPGSSTWDILPGCRLRGPCPPAFSTSCSPQLASWVGSCKEPAPRPSAYNVDDCYSLSFLSAPGVVTQGVRRPKHRDTGPLCAL